MRSSRPLIVVLAIFAVAACNASAPGWTFAPVPSVTPAPSGSGAPVTSGEPSAPASVAPSTPASVAPSAPASVAPSAPASVAPSAPASAAPSGSAGPSAAPSAAGTVVELTASQIAFDKTELAVPAGQPFQILFNNNDASVPHDVAIRQGDTTGAEVFKGDVFPGVATRTYDVPALAAGTYGFVCTVHPNMVGTLTAS